MHASTFFTMATVTVYVCVYVCTHMYAYIDLPYGTLHQQTLFCPCHAFLHYRIHLDICLPPHPQHFYPTCTPAMCVCVYIYIYIYMYVCTHTCVYCDFTRYLCPIKYHHFCPMYSCNIPICMCVCIYTCLCSVLLLGICSPKKYHHFCPTRTPPVCMCVGMYMRVHTPTHICIHLHIHLHLHTHTHTHRNHV